MIDTTIQVLELLCLLFGLLDLLLLSRILTVKMYQADNEAQVAELRRISEEVNRRQVEGFHAVLVKKIKPKAGKRKR